MLINMSAFAYELNVDGVEAWFPREVSFHAIPLEDWGRAKSYQAETENPWVSYVVTIAESDRNYINLDKPDIAFAKKLLEMGLKNEFSIYSGEITDKYYLTYGKYPLLVFEGVLQINNIKIARKGVSFIEGKRLIQVLVQCLYSQRDILDREFNRFASQFRLSGEEYLPIKQGGVSGVSTKTKINLSKDEIRSAQKKLNLLGYDAGTPDGVLGVRTISAMERFLHDVRPDAIDAEVDRGILDLLNARSDEARGYSDWFESGWHYHQVQEGRLSLLERDNYPCHIKAAGWRLLATERRKAETDPWYSLGDVWQKWAWKIVAHNPMNYKVGVQARVYLKTTSGFELGEDTIRSYLNKGQTGSWQGTLWYNADEKKDEGKPNSLGYYFVCGYIR